MGDRTAFLSATIIGGTAAMLFLLFLATGIYGGDSGDLVTAAAVGGVPHPPGYPLYTLLGHILTYLPFGTPAWQVGLLSLIPHIIVVSLVFAVVHRITGKLYPGVFAALAIMGNYLFFLYSTTAEVFGLFSFFIYAIGLMALEVYRKKRKRDMMLLCFLLSLSLTHHHVIVFLFPAVFFLLRKTFVVRTMHVYDRIKYGIAFALGLLPYLYVVFAAWGYPIINWNNPKTLDGFLKLVTREYYGTFQAGAVVSQTMIQRLLQFQLFGSFLILDISAVGLFLWIVGFIYVFQKDRHIAYSYGVALLFLGPVFLFYASFPVVNRFSLGIVERFMLQSEILFYPVIGLGMYVVSEKFFVFIHRKFMRYARVFQFILVGILFLYPVSHISMQIWRFKSLRTDETANSIGRDILQSAPYGSILLMSKDTMLFPAQYIRYALNEREDVRLFYEASLAYGDYDDVIRNKYADIRYPTTNEDDFFVQFLIQNYDQHPIVSNKAHAIGEEYEWVPIGLLYRLYKKDEAPTNEEIIKTNDDLWIRYQNPRAGILGQYDHLMLADIVHVYATYMTDYGSLLLRTKNYEKAKEYLLRSTQLANDTVTDLLQLGLAYMLMDKCDEAKSAFDTARQTMVIDDNTINLYEGYLYKDCYKDETKAAEFFSIYEGNARKKLTPL